ncbi:hypothetical protein BB558_002193 [Smittium angustum]|uniref:PIH1 N-terminal domain-containing protein n=1 Tax=Smittium angustum TaxID=133377 RepID=A0A2U1J9J4_SMIAN|nr:hypothetical protein BB558_002193 [Smittium angustum]
MSLYEIGKNMEMENLQNLNENLKSEIIKHGYIPFETNKNESESQDESFSTNKIQTEIDYQPFLSFKLPVLSSSERVHSINSIIINMCFSHSIPKPKDVGETEIQKAFNANHDANWQIPMYTSEPMYLQDEENVFVFDTIVNSSLQQRAHVDVDMKLYLIELSIEWAEDKFGIVLSRDIMQNPVPYYKTKAKHYLNENVAGLQNVQEESIQAGKRYKKTNEQKVIKNISKRSFRIRNVILNITNILLILDIDSKVL